jgi:hypothetical protein
MERILVVIGIVGMLIIGIWWAVMDAIDLWK